MTKTGYVITFCDGFCELQFLKAGMLAIHNQNNGPLNICGAAMQMNNLVSAYNQLAKQLKIFEDGIKILDKEYIIVA